MRNINKKGNANTKATVAIVLGVILLIAVIAVGVKVFGGTAYTVSGSNVKTNTDGSVNVPVVLATNCAIQPTVSITGQNALVTSTAATPTTINYFLNGAYFGTSAPSLKIGDKLKIIGDLAGYLSAESNEITVDCGAQPLITKQYSYANASVTIKDDIKSVGNTLTNSATGETNGTKASAGGSVTLPVIFSGTSQKSSSKIFWVVESPASYGVNISSMTVSCNGDELAQVSIPSVVSAANAGSARIAVEVPAIIGSSDRTCYLKIQNTATGVVQGAFVNTFYAEQTFVDANGNVQTGIYDTSVNGNNAVKYQDSYTYTFVLA